MKRRRSLPAALACLIALVALAAPALAAAARPNATWFAGKDGQGGTIKFHVQIGQFNNPTIDRADYAPEGNPELKRQADFDRVNVKNDRFETCAFERVSQVYSREYCITGQFDAPDHADGKMTVYISVAGERWHKPLDSFRWDAREQQP